MENAVKSRLQSVQFGEVQAFKNIAIVRIPVSCTEQGRWSYASKAFSESGNVMAYKSRSKKTRSVQCSLEESGVHHSSQGEVWHGIAELQAKAGASSATSAMSDIYKARDADLHQCDEIFESVPNQVGIFVMIDGRPAGVDMVSLIAFSVSAFSLVRFRPGPRKGSHPRRLLSPGRNRTTRANGFILCPTPALLRIVASSSRLATRAGASLHPCHHGYKSTHPQAKQLHCRSLPFRLEHVQQTKVARNQVGRTPAWFLTTCPLMHRLTTINMTETAKKTKFSGHQTFAFRYGWLEKGVNAVEEFPQVFAEEDAIVRLGVGKNMVESIRHWCHVAQLIEEDSAPKPSGSQPLRVTPLAKKLFLKPAWDPFLEDDASLWLVHWLLVSNPRQGTSWQLAFGHFHRPDSVVIGRLSAVVIFRDWAESGTWGFLTSDVPSPICDTAVTRL